MYEFIDKLIMNTKPFMDLAFCERMGYDCAKNGANEQNCNFRIFGSVEGKEAWERGKKKFEEEQILLKQR